jgi:hypothetical protein
MIISVFMCLILKLQAQDMLIRNADEFFKKQQYNRAIEPVSYTHLTLPTN